MLQFNASSSLKVVKEFENLSTPKTEITISKEAVALNYPPSRNLPEFLSKMI
jgi:hypothetical protein